MEKHNKAFGSALRSFRKHKKLTQDILALDAGLDRTSISLLELGQRSPTLDTIIALCNTLEISLTEFAAVVDIKIRETK